MPNSFDRLFMGAAGGEVLPSDDEFNNVSFLSHFDGANNGTNIVYDDGSASNHTITTVGTPPQGTFGPFARVDGEWSNYIGPGAGSSSGAALQAASSSDFTLDGEYTIEFFVNLTSTAAQYFFAIGDTSNANDMELGLASGTTLRLYQGGAYKTFSTGSELKVNTWHHVAVTRNGSNLVTCWVDGTALGTTFTVTEDADGTATVGATFYSTAYYNSCLGHISNFRILKGTCLYTSNFTAPTAPLTAITNTKLLTCQSNRFVDNSASAHTITVAQTPKVTAFTPILTSKVYDSAVNGASGYFDGSNDVVHLDASGSDFNFGTGDFTMEGWIYNEGTGHTSYAYPLAAGAMLQFYIYQNNRILFNMTYSEGGASAFTLEGTPGGSGATFPIRQWYHWAVTKSGSNASVFINGTRNATSSSVSGTFSAPTGNMFVGAYNATPEYQFGGYQSDFRIVKGTAVYDPTSSTCTVPTAPLTAITNTKLLLNMAAGQVLDSAAQNNMTLYGNADTSTTQQKFGTASLFLDGSGDYLTFPAEPKFIFGSGNFTIECWVYRSDSGTTHNCFFNIGDQVQLYVYNNSIDCYFRPAAVGLTGPAASIVQQTWYHVAAVRNGSTFTAYVNGVGGTPITSSATLDDYDNTNATIGRYLPGSNLQFAGYIDEFRISHFARYTSNFTPTTEAFPDKGQ